MKRITDSFLISVSLELLVIAALMMSELPTNIVTEIGYFVIGYTAWYYLSLKTVMYLQIKRYGFWIT